MKIALVVAMARNRVIGCDGALPWRLPADLQRFRAITMGKPIVMGRRTHESIGRPLPGRRNIVLSRAADYAAPGCEVWPSLSSALNALRELEEVMIVGGAALYVEALPFADTLYLTEVDAAPRGDVYFPEFDRNAWREVANETHAADAHNQYPYCFRVLARLNRTAPRSTT